jgi:aryl-alcohol dehydrogenase-like predicted oxidoreductase
MYVYRNDPLESFQRKTDNQPKEEPHMKRLKLFGNTPAPFEVSQIALGCDHYDENVPAKDALAVMDAYFAAGGNILDTAHIYSQMTPGGISLSEKLVGEWLRANNARDKVMLITKGAHPDRNDMTATRITEKIVREEFELSLETLGVDSVDVWFVHRDNPAVPAAEIIDMLTAVTKGRAKHLGASNWTGARMDEANAHARKNGNAGFEISQIQWSLARVTKDSWGDSTMVIMDEEETAWYAKTQMPVMVFSSQAHGLFSKVIERGRESLTKKFATRFQLEANMDRIERCREVSKRTGVNPAGICLSYLTTAPFPVMPLIGCSRPEQVADSLRFADFELTAEDRAFLIAD